MSSNTELVERYIAALRAGDLDAAGAVFSDDLEYHFHVGSKPIIGKERFLKMLRAVGPHQINSRIRITSIAETANGVLYEAVDEHDDTTVNQHVVLPYMGSYEIRDGAIAVARDYFDMGVYDAAKAGAERPAWLAKFSESGD